MEDGGGEKAERGEREIRVLKICQGEQTERENGTTKSKEADLVQRKHVFSGALALL